MQCHDDFFSEYEIGYLQNLIWDLPRLRKKFDMFFDRKIVYIIKLTDNMIFVHSGSHASLSCTII